MEYEYRIVESGHGGFDVQKGFTHKGGERVPGMLGFTMPGFMVYESAHADNIRQAKSKLKRMKQRR